MAAIIDDNCTLCDACRQECPNDAIVDDMGNKGGDIYLVKADMCTECAGQFDEPQCIEVCPSEAIKIA